MKMKNSLEGIVIKWACQVDEVLKESSLSLFEKNNHPTPMAEVNFWMNRRKNVMNIYNQLIDPRVKKVGSILELIDSVYFSTFSSTFKNVVTALHEANDISLYLLPLVRIQDNTSRLTKVSTRFLLLHSPLISSDSRKMNFLRTRRKLFHFIMSSA